MSIEQKNTATFADQQSQKPYQTPTLVKYGALHQHTNGASGTVGDGNTSMNMRQSDERLKTNIKKIGEHKASFGLYLFDYKLEHQHFGTGRQFGVMAQEVEAIMPEAVSFGENGYRKVDYAMLGITLTKH